MPAVRLLTAALATILATRVPANAQSSVPSPSTDGTAPHSTKAALHQHRRHLARGAARPVQPLAAQQPASTGPSNVGPAPVPNQAVAAPIDDPNPTASVAPSVFQLHYPPQGDGYVTGSSSQAMDDREAAKATGVEVKVPLPQ